MSRQLVHELTLLPAHALELVHPVLKVRFFGFDNQLGELVVYFLGEELVFPGHFLERLGILGWSDLGGDVGVFQLERQRHPAVALDLRALLVALQLVLVAAAREVVAADVDAVATVALEHLGGQLGGADPTVLALVLTANHHPAQMAARTLHLHPFVAWRFWAFSVVTRRSAPMAARLAWKRARLRARVSTRSLVTQAKARVAAASQLAAARPPARQTVQMTHHVLPHLVFSIALL